MRVLTTLEKRMEDINETLTTEIKEVKKNQKMKSTINGIRNMHDAKNSRLKESEEQIHDLEDKIIESNEVEQKGKNTANRT